MLKNCKAHGSFVSAEIDGTDVVVACALEVRSMSDETAHKYAERIAACVNACKGKSTELLEAAADYASWDPPHPIFNLALERDELLAALKNITEAYKRDMIGVEHTRPEIADAEHAIAKAERP